MAIADDALPLGRAAEKALSRIRAHLYNAPPGPDDWEALADSPYAAFAREALEAAAVRAAAIQAGKECYVADHAFTSDEVGVLGRSARVALLRDEPWLPELLGRLLPAVAVAPTAARTLPSQALLFEVTRAAREFPTPEVVTALRSVRGVIRHRGVPRQLDRNLKQIDAALADRPETAFRQPDLGFGPDGVFRRTAGAYEGLVTVSDEVLMTWRRAGGASLRGVPAAVRRDHPEELGELRDLVRRTRAHVATLTRALEGGLVTSTSYAYDHWREAFATHPVGRPIAERLIWEVEVARGEWRAALPVDDALVDVDGRPVTGSAVRLWHPIRSRVEEIRAWRDLLTDRDIRQPFRQAFREIYPLTPAELETRVYSNRFAAHILRYQRLYALLKTRAWSTHMLGPWDGGDEAEATREVAGRRWRARFFHSYVEGYAETALAGTDQVRFDRREGGEWHEAALADVPPVVFSELMRDVDLFVGVTSIAADPEWADRGEDRHRTYWYSHGFGELTAAAEVRRDTLARLLPRTKIASCTSLDERFLVVRGSLRTYKIHLGSANILMEPDDVYLCIVRGRGGETVHLPFEDDRLALILSKAFLLADDAAIEDESIMRQIKRGR
ncbi:DUF4132 domain-containing protein [Actinomadura sp. DC4]|uniref:DUF4132 domain-containing protein n=1 Tax=Actinomadura sp. DC4 TaxID=3055069 RepID=UPI0025B2457C|nr:DUF4132 domain-containing protein [Actinomadura sp. DC4]MDN3351588.1 DUF4132 domain-containing protein [Actinomadura sp. DC4]